MQPEADDTCTCSPCRTWLRRLAKFLRRTCRRLRRRFRRKSRKIKDGKQPKNKQGRSTTKRSSAHKDKPSRKKKTSRSAKPKTERMPKENNEAEHVKSDRPKRNKVTPAHEGLEKVEAEHVKSGRPKRNKVKPAHVAPEKVEEPITTTDFSRFFTNVHLPEKSGTCSESPQQKVPTDDPWGKSEGGTCTPPGRVEKMPSSDSELNVRGDNTSLSSKSDVSLFIEGLVLKLAMQVGNAEEMRSDSEYELQQNC